jgi:hypothetical protein
MLGFAVPITVGVAFAPSLQPIATSRKELNVLRRVTTASACRCIRTMTAWRGEGDQPHAAGLAERQRIRALKGKTAVRAGLSRGPKGRRRDDLLLRGGDRASAQITLRNRYFRCGFQETRNVSSDTQNIPLRTWFLFVQFGARRGQHDPAAGHGKRGVIAVRPTARATPPPPNSRKCSRSRFPSILL